MANTVNELRKTSKGRLSYQRKRTLEDIYKEIDNFICLSVTPVKNYEFEKQEKVNIGSVTKSAPKKFKVEKTVESSKNFVDSDAISKYAQIEQSLIDYELERKNYVKKQIAERLASWEKCSLEYRKKFETCSSEVSKEPEKHENANTTQNTSESQEVNNNSLNTQWITKEETQLSKEKAKQPEEELLIEKERKLEILEKLNMIYLKLKFIASEILEKYNRLNCKNQPNKGINLIYRLKDIVTLMDSYSISDDPDMYLETAKSHLEECRRMLKFFTDLGNSNENDMNNNSSAIECSEVDNIVSGSSETDITITQNAAMDVVPQISMDVMNCNAVASQSPPLEFVSFPQSNKLSSLTSSDQTTKNCRNFEIKIHKFKKIQKPEISISESAVAISKVPESTSTNVFQGVTVSEISSKSQILASENMQLDENKKADSNEFSKDETHCQYVDKDALIEYTALLQFAETWKNLYQTFVTDSKI
ncbi:uncharacterized protein LOC111640931 [Centruroides sculpturatus]|uniref:uncharacterized protein LOC111640931 n=1 Tax=Centruroides sculpturatus TaxID=218467 RepID=UPI000C6CEB4F|nr:uncharacterized protein LOC111640931 [Centruroides sculpturatus]